MASSAFAACNPAVLPQNCTFETCCAAQSHFAYLPTYSGNLFFAICFGLLLLPQLGLGIFYRTWGFLAGMLLGLALEVLGYVSRVQLHQNPFAGNPFLMYLIALTIAPVFITAAIYLCLTRIIVLHGQNLSRFAPKTIAIVFMTSDFSSLLLQAIGGAIAEIALEDSTQRTGINIMIAGLVLQALSLLVFLAVVGDFARSCSGAALSPDPQKRKTRSRAIFKAFMAGLVLATVLILIRSIFRAAELWGGFQGPLWNDETDFLVLDGAMMAVSTVVLTALHPGPAFGGEWHAADWSLKKKKKGTAEGGYLLASKEVEPAL
ncbi:hypothetical protein LTR08_006918 [Meristemomyces frigidus]|nr:hypothetical protein LTR08_006918 [Meristemomyces frigidus]